MTTAELEIKNVTDRLSYWIVQLRSIRSLYLYDGNKLAESISMKLLNLVYNLKLVDLNEEQANAAGIDLGDKAAGIAFQISTRDDNAKVIDSLRKVVKYDLAKDYPNGIRFLVLSDGGKVVFKEIKPTAILSTFDEDRDIVYIETLNRLIKRIYETDEARFWAIKEVLEKEIKYPNPAPDENGVFVNSGDLLALVKEELQKNEQYRSSQSVSFATEFAPDFSLPILSPISQRQETVNEHLAKLEVTSILWITGGIGTGKTGLAYLLGKHFEPGVFWIDMRDYLEGDFALQIVKQLCSHLGVEAQSSFTGTLSNLVGKLPVGAVFILNDFPNVAGKEKLKQGFTRLLQALDQGGVKVIITSNYPLYSELEVALHQRIIPLTIQPFTDEEVGDVLRYYGGDDSFVKDNQLVVNAVTDGHALLINAAARYLRDHDWDLSDQAFTDLFKSNYGQEYTSEIYSRIIDTTQNEETKNLLYRMAAVLGSFSDNEIAVVGAVDPVITGIHERSQLLKGFWLQESDRGRFQLSPMVKRLPSNLTEASWQAIKAALGDHILSKGRLSQIDASTALSYYLEGKEFVKLAGVLLRVLEESTKNPALFFDWGFALFWYYAAIPSEVPPFFKVMIRAFQIQVSLAAGRDTDYLGSDLEQLLQEEGGDTVAKAYGCLTISHLTLRKDPVKSFRYLIQAKHGIAALDRQVSAVYVSENNWKDYIWTSFYSLRTQSQFVNWFAQFDQIKGEIDIDALEQVGQYVAAAHNLVQVAAGTTNENATDTVNTLETVYRAAIDADLPLMAVYAVRYLISIQADHFKDLQAAEQYIVDNVALIESKPIYTYLLKEQYGRQLFYVGKKEEALKVLSEVIDIPVASPFLEGVEGYRVYAQLISESNEAIAHDYICKALEKVLGDPSNGEVLRVKIQAEVGISFWLNGDNTKALYQLAAAYERLMKIYSGSQEEQAAIIRLASDANYIKAMLIDGKPPTKTADGGDYAIPTRGHYFHDNANLLADGFYFEERRFMGTIVFEEAFWYLNYYASARTWAFYGMEICLSLAESKYFPVLLKTLSYLVIDRQYVKAINLYGEIERRLQQIKQRIDEGENLEGFIQARALMSVKSDAFFYQVVVQPIAITIVHDVVVKRATIADYRPLLKDVFTAMEGIHLFDPASLEFLRQLFDAVLFQGINRQQLEDLVKTYTGPYVSQMTSTGYLLQSISADAQGSAWLHLSIHKEFEATQHLCPPFFKFEVLSFLEGFWIQKFEDYSQQVEDRAFWRSKSIPYIQAAEPSQKIKSLFKTIVHHLNVPTPPSIDDWLDS